MCPALNEEKHIEQILEFFISSKPAEKELFIIDGGSTDGTVEIIKKYLSYENVHLLHNKKKYVPFALNMAIPLCKGDIIARIDAHTTYSQDYFEKILETFKTVETDVVGGPVRTKSKTTFQEATANVISSKFGTGDSKAHYVDFTGYTNHVSLAAYKREVFNDVGLFDERMIRNQDDEHLYRANSFGKKIYLNPEIKYWYYPRDKFKRFFKQYFQYGLFKPIVLLKLKSEIKLRHLIPSFFTLYLASLPIAFLTPLWLLPLVCYFLLDVVFTSKANVKAKTKLFMFLLFPAIHLAYGSGVIYGLLTIQKRNKTVDLKTKY